MDTFDTARELQMMKRKKQMLEDMRDSAIKRMQCAAGGHAHRRAQMELARITGEITRCNDVIFSAELKLGISPPGGEPGG